jgi:osmotically-inducible protein OsmY
MQPMAYPPSWTYPGDRYYYGWYNKLPPSPPSDSEIKATLVDRLRENPYAKEGHIAVDVKRGVVILTGDVASLLAKRAAGDDAWDTRGVTDVSNQLSVPGT